jgi:hypothetical protein
MSGSSPSGAPPYRPGPAARKWRRTASCSFKIVLLKSTPCKGQGFDDSCIKLSTEKREIPSVKVESGTCHKQYCLPVFLNPRSKMIVVHINILYIVVLLMAAHLISILAISAMTLLVSGATLKW